MNTSIAEIKTPTLVRPTIKLPPGFAILANTAKSLPSLIQSGASTLRSEIKKIPLLDTENLFFEGAVRLAMLYYHMLQSAYVHAGEGAWVLPENIAVPSYNLSLRLREDGYSKPPMLGYLSYVLDNWKLKDGDAPFSIENLEPLVTFTGTESEKVFILTHLTPFEYLGEGGLQLCTFLRNFTEDRNLPGIKKSLETLTYLLLQMSEGFAQIEKYVSPEIYRTSIRQYLMSFTGVIYDGVKEYGQAPQFFTGASGAQTVTIPAFSLALGIRHKHEKILESLIATQKYLHPQHQRFLRFIEEGPNLWGYLKKNRSEITGVITAYNTCLRSLENFRITHAKFIASYIAPGGSDSRGTGNTIIPWWLNALIQETREYYL